MVLRDGILGEVIKSERSALMNELVPCHKGLEETSSGHFALLSP